ncbi:MAG: transcription termination/antitermination protein NusG [Patescibacteria group bacterium]
MPMNDNPILSERGFGKKAIQGHIIITPNAPDTAKWYVVHTQSGHEARIAETLRQRVNTLNQADKVFEVLIPTQDKIVIKHGKKSTIKEKIFPGYMLVLMIVDDASWLVVRTTAGVTGFVGVGNKPTPLSNIEVEAIQQFSTVGTPKFKTKFTTGEAVKITDGPFTDFLGSIESIDETAGKLKVLVSIFGRETPVELDFLQVKKI